jgi:hypothetical protein
MLVSFAAIRAIANNAVAQSTFCGHVIVARMGEIVHQAHRMVPSALLFAGVQP